MEDKRYLKFELNNIKRSGSYTAYIYDGNKDMSKKLEFRAQKQTREVDLF